MIRAIFRGVIELIGWGIVILAICGGVASLTNVTDGDLLEGLFGVVFVSSFGILLVSICRRDRKRQRDDKRSGLIQSGSRQSERHLAMGKMGVPSIVASVVVIVGSIALAPNSLRNWRNAGVGHSYATIVGRFGDASAIPPARMQSILKVAQEDGYKCMGLHFLGETLPFTFLLLITIRLMSWSLTAAGRRRWAIQYLLVSALGSIFLALAMPYTTGSPRFPETLKSSSLLYAGIAVVLLPIAWLGSYLGRGRGSALASTRTAVSRGGPKGIDQAIYNQVAAEISRSYFRDGLLVRAKAESGGNKDIQESLYIRLRAQQIADGDDPPVREHAVVAQRDAVHSHEQRTAAPQKATGSFLLVLVPAAIALAALWRNGTLAWMCWVVAGVWLLCWLSVSAARTARNDLAAGRTSNQKVTDFWEVAASLSMWAHWAVCAFACVLALAMR